MKASLKAKLLAEDKALVTSAKPITRVFDKPGRFSGLTVEPAYVMKDGRKVLVSAAPPRKAPGKVISSTNASTARPTYKRIVQANHVIPTQRDGSKGFVREVTQGPIKANPIDETLSDYAISKLDFSASTEWDTWKLVNPDAKRSGAQRKVNKRVSNPDVLPHIDNVPERLKANTDLHNMALEAGLIQQKTKPNKVKKQQGNTPMVVKTAGYL